MSPDPVDWAPMAAGYAIGGGLRRGLVSLRP